MTTGIKGNCISISFDANELTDQRVFITLPDGYSYESIHILNLINISEIAPYFVITNNNSYHIPPVRSHSPSTFGILVDDLSKRANIRVLIEKFGQIPDPHYFDKAFEPILVTGNDGNEYYAIPSDQFK